MIGLQETISNLWKTSWRNFKSFSPPIPVNFICLAHIALPVNKIYKKTQNSFAHFKRIIHTQIWEYYCSMIDSHGKVILNRNRRVLACVCAPYLRWGGLVCSDNWTVDHYHVAGYARHRRILSYGL